MGADNLVGRLWQEAETGLVRLETHPDSAKDYILVDDVVRLLCRIANDGRERMYNVASGIQTRHRQWLSALQEATGCIVQSDMQSPMQSFPAINIERIQTEFRFEPTPIFDKLGRLPKIRVN